MRERPDRFVVRGLEWPLDDEWLDEMRRGRVFKVELVLRIEEQKHIKNRPRPHWIASVLGVHRVHD